MRDNHKKVWLPDRQTDARQSDPYVLLCFAGNTTKARCSRIPFWGHKKPFLKQSSQSKSQSQWSWYHLQGHDGWSMHAKYEVSIYCGSKVIAKDKAICLWKVNALHVTKSIWGQSFNVIHYNLPHRNFTSLYTSLKSSLCKYLTTWMQVRVSWCRKFVS